MSLFLELKAWLSALHNCFLCGGVEKFMAIVVDNLS